jgi:excisionase family DNA binding protein
MKKREYYTVKEASELLGWSVDVIYQGCRTERIRTLPKLTPGGQWRIPSEEIDRLMGKIAESIQLSHKDITKQEVDPILLKAKEEHLTEIRDLIERWLEAIPNDPPGVNELGSWSFNRWGLPTGFNSITGEYLFKSVREHLPYEEFWDNYTTWEKLFIEYIHACVDIEQEIRRKGEAWSLKPELCKDFEEPILSQIFTKQMHMPIDKLRFRIYGSKLYTYCIYQDNGQKSPETEILKAQYPKGCADRYRALSDEILNSKEVDWLVNTQVELGRRQNFIRETLQAVLSRRDYINHSCSLCPGTLSES